MLGRLWILRNLPGLLSQLPFVRENKRPPGRGCNVAVLVVSHPACNHVAESVVHGFWKEARIDPLQVRTACCLTEIVDHAVPFLRSSGPLGISPFNLSWPAQP